MKYILRLVVGGFVLGTIFFLGFCITIPEGKVAVITHFGTPSGTITEPGLHLKWPWPIDDLYLFDSRKRLYNTKFTQTLTRDKRAVILLTYIVWKIDDPLVFLQSLSSIGNAEQKLESITSNAKNNVLGNFDLSALVSTDQTKLKVEQIENEILSGVSSKAKEKFGIQVLRTGIKRVAFPENNVTAIFEQMRAERAQYAAEYRAEGYEKSSNIRSNTDLEVARIKAEAVRKAEEIRGKADREAAEIYAQAHTQGSDFYKLLRSLEALDRIIDKNSVFVIRDDQAPFSTLKLNLDLEFDK